MGALEGIKPWDVIYVPSGVSYLRSWKGYDDNQMISANDRYELLREAVQPFGFGVAKVETLGITHKTYDTMHYLGFDDAFLCLGTDNVAQMKKWYRYKELLENISLIVFERACSKTSDDPEIKEILEMARSYIIVSLPDECTGVSSTLVRESMDNGDLGLVDTLVPGNVYDYLVNRAMIGK